MLVDPVWKRDHSIVKFRELLRACNDHIQLKLTGTPTTLFINVEEAFAKTFGENSRQFKKLDSFIKAPFIGIAGAGSDPEENRLRELSDLIYGYIVTLETEPKETNKSVEQTALEHLKLLFDRFPTVASNLASRRATRKPLLISDEYDVQYLLQALLKVYFDDVRPEDSSPSVAGKNARIDFILESEKIAIEVKMTRETLGEKQLGEELFVDIKRYQKHPSCTSLVCFVFDPKHYIKNPIGL
jgi:REase_DpnII-MboI